VTPELCTTPGFRAKLEVLHNDGELNRIVVDEAHCISGLDHDRLETDGDVRDADGRQNGDMISEQRSNNCIGSSVNFLPFR